MCVRIRERESGERESARASKRLTERERERAHAREREECDKVALSSCYVCVLQRERNGYICI